MNYIVSKALLKILNLTKLSMTVPDKVYLKMAFSSVMHRSLNLNHPQTFNEKLQWLKLYQRDPKYTKLVDKSGVKRIVAKQLGSDFVIPTIGEWNSTAEIKLDELPQQFVLKCTHDSGSVVICKDRTSFDWPTEKKILDEGLASDYYMSGREWPYRDVPHKIIAEPLLVPDNGGSLIDYKFFCFNGLAEMVMLCIGRETGNTKFYFFDRDWNLLRLNKQGASAPEGFSVPKPNSIDKMFAIADKLSSDIPFVRVDLYSSGNIIKFGEMTFFPDSGFDVNILPDADFKLGELLTLPDKFLEVL